MDNKVCYFLVGQIAQHCDAAVICVGGAGEYVTMRAEKWGDEITIWENTKTIQYPVTMPERDFLVISGAAAQDGYTLDEFLDDDFMALLDGNKAKGAK